MGENYVIMRKIKTGSDFSGIGAFDEACKRVFGEENIENVFACDMDKYARKSYLANYKEPGYFPTDVYNREIPSESLDIYMTSPPCQGFSIAGKRGGSILFFNSHEFIHVNKPRFFIFENVKGLLSHEKNKNNKDQEIGATFQNWLRFLGGKSINGAPTIFADKNAVPYHIYWRVLNSKEHNIPQNRERVFIVGIRDDADNDFSWPQIEPLNLRLKDVLENDVPRKYFLSEKMVDYLMKNSEMQQENGNGFKFSTVENCDYAKAITTKPGQRMDDNFLKIGYEIRRLTPRECLRLQDFPDTFKIVVSDSQIYKQAGNSITVRVLEKILIKLKPMLTQCN